MLNRFTFLASVIGCASLAFSQTLQEDLVKVCQNNRVVGMSVVAWCRGEITDVFSYGQRDIARNLPVDNSTRYRIASISKHVLTIGLMQQYEKGAFHLDDDVSDVLGFKLRNPHFPHVPITYRMLLSHQSSLRDSDVYYKFMLHTVASSGRDIPPLSQLLLANGAWFSLSHFSQTKAPGTFFEYSNMCFGILATVLEKLTKERFDVYIRQNVLLPLQVKASFNLWDIEDINNMSVLYTNGNPQADDYKGVMPPKPDMTGYVPGTNAFKFSPQAGLKITALELAKIQNMFYR